MLKRPQRFTENKQVVRDLQCETIRKYLHSRLGQLRYFGLPSSSLEDVEQWSPLLTHITAVERGDQGREWMRQHELLLNAFKLGISDKLTLLRGDIDDIIIHDTDAFKHEPCWPYDIVSLDYSGGLFYKRTVNSNLPERLEAIKQLFVRQSSSEAADFVFFLSFNLDNIDQREVRSSLDGMRRDLRRFGDQADEVMNLYLAHPKDQARLKLYVLRLINHLAIQASFNTFSESPILYLGNKDMPMMAFRFYHKASRGTFSPRLPRERLNQLVNLRMIEIVNGKQSFTNLKLSLIKAPV